MDFSADFHRIFQALVAIHHVSDLASDTQAVVQTFQNANCGGGVRSTVERQNGRTGLQLGFLLGAFLGFSHALGQIDQVLFHQSTAVDQLGDKAHDHVESSAQSLHDAFADFLGRVLQTFQGFHGDLATGLLVVERLRGVGLALHLETQRTHDGFMGDLHHSSFGFSHAVTVLTDFAFGYLFTISSQRSFSHASQFSDGVLSAFGVRDAGIDSFDLSHVLTNFVGDFSNFGSGFSSTDVVLCCCEHFLLFQGFLSMDDLCETRHVVLLFEKET